MWQAAHIQSRLAALYPRIADHHSRHDHAGRPRSRHLAGQDRRQGIVRQGTRGRAGEGRADIAVHSMKDVPMKLPRGFRACRDQRARRPARRLGLQPISTASARCRPAAVVGTSSLRRESQLRARFPHLVIEPLRGNVQTRLRKLDEGQYAAIILAAAGLKRLGLGDRITAAAHARGKPAGGGPGRARHRMPRRPRAISSALLAPLNHRATAACVLAERALSRALAGSCQVPLGGFAEISGGNLRLRGFVGAPDGKRHGERGAGRRRSRSRGAGHGAGGETQGAGRRRNPRRTRGGRHA